MAARMRWYVPHRQMLPAIAASMSASVGCGVRRKRATALIKEVKLEEEKKRVIDFATASVFLRNLVNVAFFGELERLAQEAPANLKGQNEISIADYMSKQVKATKDSLLASLAEWDEKGKKDE